MLLDGEPVEAGVGVADTRLDEAEVGVGRSPAKGGVSSTERSDACHRIWIAGSVCCDDDVTVAQSTALAWHDQSLPSHC
jgi:hypothetical protein